jgi:hypothetical protein
VTWRVSHFLGVQWLVKSGNQQWGFVLFCFLMWTIYLVSLVSPNMCVKWFEVSIKMKLLAWNIPRYRKSGFWNRPWKLEGVVSTVQWQAREGPELRRGAAGGETQLLRKRTEETGVGKWLHSSAPLKDKEKGKQALEHSQFLLVPQEFPRMGFPKKWRCAGKPTA